MNGQLCLFDTALSKCFQIGAPTTTKTTKTKTKPKTTISCDTTSERVFGFLGASRSITTGSSKVVKSFWEFFHNPKRINQSKDRLRRLDMVWLVSTIIQYYAYHYIYMRWNASHPHFRNRAERNWMALPDIRSKYVIVSQAGILKLPASFLLNHVFPYGALQQHQLPFLVVRECRHGCRHLIRQGTAKLRAKCKICSLSVCLSACPTKFFYWLMQLHPFLIVEKLFIWSKKTKIHVTSRHIDLQNQISSICGTYILQNNTHLSFPPIELQFLFSSAPISFTNIKNACFGYPSSKSANNEQPISFKPTIGEIEKATITLRGNHNS